jgi:hypothetical protein
LQTGLIQLKIIFILAKSQVIDKKRCNVFALYNRKLEKIKDLVIEPIDPSISTLILSSWPRCRSWNDKIFISQPHKGFYIEVFNKNGQKLYHIEKKVKKIKSEEKHRTMYKEEIRYFLGRSRFEKARARGIFKRPLREYIPPIKNFWVLDNRIYVKTYEMSGTKEKYIIMDEKGTILKTLFLPKTYLEILTFSKNKFYYLEESEDDECWALHAVQL